MYILNKIEDIIRQGYTVEFSTSINQLQIKVSKQRLSLISSVTQMLPLREDHFNEAKIYDCLDFMLQHLKKDHV